MIFPLRFLMMRAPLYFLLYLTFYSLFGQQNQFLLVNNVFSMKLLSAPFG